MSNKMQLKDLGVVTLYIKQTGKYALDLLDAAKASKILTAEQANLVRTMVAASTTEGTAAAATSGLEMTLRGLWATITAHPIGALLTVLAGVSIAISRVHKKLQDMRQEQVDHGKAAKADADNILSLRAAYDEANAAYDGSKESKEKLDEATRNLLKSLGIEEDEIGRLEKKYGDLAKALDNVTLKKLEEKQRDMIDAVAAAESKLLHDFGRHSTLIEYNNEDNALFQKLIDMGLFKMEEEREAFSDAVSSAFFLKGGDYSADGLLAARDDAKELLTLLEQAADELDMARSSLHNTSIWMGLDSFIKSVDDELRQVEEARKNLADSVVSIDYETGVRSGKYTIPKTVDQYYKLRDSLIEASKGNEAFRGSIEATADSVDRVLGGKAFSKDFASGINEFRHNMKKLPEAWRRFLSAMNITEKSKGFFESVFGGDSADDKALREWAEACGYSIDDVIAGFKLLREEADNAAAAAENAVKKESTALEAFRQQIGTLRIDIVKALGEGKELSEEQNKVFEKWAQSIGYSKDQLDDLYGLFQKFYKESPPELIDAKSVGDTLRKARREFIKALSADKNSEMFKAASERLRMAEQSAHAYAQYYILDDVADLVTLRDELKKTEKAWQDYQKVIEGGDPEEEANNYAGALKKALDDIYKGRYDTGSVWGAAKLLFSDKQLAEWKYDLGRIAQELNSDFIYGLFGDPQNEDEIADYAARLSNYLIEHADTMKSVDIIEDPDRGTFQFWYSSLKELADDMGLTEGAVASLLKALDAYGVQMIQSGEESRKFVDDYRRLLDLYDKATAKEELIRGMAQQGVWEPHALEILDNLRNAGIIEGDDSEFIEMIQRIYKEVAEANEQEISINANLDPYEKTLKQAEQLYDLLKAKLESGAIEIRAKLVDESETSSAGINAGKIAAAKNRTLGKASASGTRDAQGGTTLVNEKGPELISDNGKAFIVNHGEPGFVNLSRGAVVFNADETRQIFAHGYLYTPAKAYADGTGSAFDRASIRERLLSGGRVGGMFTGGISKTKTCSKCGYSWKYSPIDYPNGFTGTCGNCGARYENGNLVTTKSAAKQIINNSPSQGKTKVGYKTCPYCQGEVLASKNVCPYCTYNFSTGRLGATDTGGSSISDTGAGKSILSGFTKGSTSKKQNTVTIKSMHDLVPGNPNRKNDSYTGSGGGSSVGSADYVSEADPQKVDWIAVVLNRIQKGVAALEKIASSGFKSLGSRMTAATEQIKGVNKEIETQQKAAERYMAEADSVGLSPELAALVQSGAIDINEYDDETRDLIDKYSEWYEKALDAKYAVEELRQEVADLFVDMYNTTQTDFENQLSQIEHRANMVNASMADTKARGYLDSAEYYKQLSDIETEKIGKLNEELDGLRTKFHEAMDSGTIEANSEAWYGMAASIHETEEAIAAANTQLIEYQKTMRSIEWSYFDYAQERFGQLQQEANFLIGIMSNDKLFEDNGRYTDKGTATMGLRVMDYNAYMVQADAYAMEMRKINKELAKDPYDTELIARRETLLGLQQQAIQAAESEKDAIRDLVSQGIQLELSAVKELIDAYEESLDSAKD